MAEQGADLIGAVDRERNGFFIDNRFRTDH